MNTQHSQLMNNKQEHDNHNLFLGNDMLGGNWREEVMITDRAQFVSQ